MLTNQIGVVDQSALSPFEHPLGRASCVPPMRIVRAHTKGNEDAAKAVVYFHTGRTEMPYMENPELLASLELQRLAIAKELEGIEFFMSFNPENMLHHKAGGPTPIHDSVFVPKLKLFYLNIAERLTEIKMAYSCSVTLDITTGAELWFGNVPKRNASFRVVSNVPRVNGVGYDRVTVETAKLNGGCSIIIDQSSKELIELFYLYAGSKSGIIEMEWHP